MTQAPSNSSLPLRPAAFTAWPACVLFVVVLAAIAVRSWLLFSTSLVPGMNGGYYLVQARALLTAGALGIPDLPLTFSLQAALAKLMQWLTGRDLESSIFLVVKLFDAMVPPLVALPVFLLGRAWSERAGRGAWLAVAAASVVALGSPALSMVGDFQKNSLGLVWLAGLIYALFLWKRHRTVGCGIGVVAMLGLTGLTHIGVFGTALLLVAAVFAAGVLLPRDEAGGKRVRVAWPLVAGGLAVAALAAGLVLWKFDPARIHRLVNAFSNPTSFLGGRRPPMRSPTSGALPGFAKGGLQRSGEPMFGPPPGEGPMGGPPPGDNSMGGMRPPVGGFLNSLMRGPGPGAGPGAGPFMFARWMPMVVVGGITLCVFVLAWWKRRVLPPAESAVGIGCAVTALLLTGPWVQGDVAGRFYLNAVLPATVAGLFVLMQVPNLWLRSLLAVVTVAPLVGFSAPMVARGGHPIISETAYRELKNLAARIPHPERTLIVTRHGVEWWTAWTLHTRVAQGRAVRTDDWQKYDEVFFLQSKERGPGFGPPGGGPGRGLRQADGSFRSRAGKGFGGGFRPSGLPQFGKGPGGFQGRGGPPMMDAAIPDDAEILHDGPCFKLAKVTKPPASVSLNKPGDADADRP